MDVLRLLGLQFYGRHGTEPWERETGCRFEVDVELEADFSRAQAGDRLEDAVDYRRVCAEVRAVVEGETHALIERVAGGVANRLIAAFPVDAVRVRVAKPEARIGGINRTVEFETVRTRPAESPVRKPAAAARKPGRSPLPPQRTRKGPAA